MASDEHILMCLFAYRLYIILSEIPVHVFAYFQIRLFFFSYWVLRVS